jgi:hypothetical protein
MRRFAIGIALLGACGTGEAPSSSPPASGAAALPPETLALVLVEAGKTQLVVDLVYHRPEGAPGPRMMELYMSLSAGLGLVSGEAGEAAARAGKEVTVQQKDAGVLRTVLMATTNLHELESGSLVRYRLDRLGAQQRLELLPEDPVFAPPEANQGLSFGAPLVVGGP